MAFSTWLFIVPITTMVLFSLYQVITIRKGIHVLAREIYAVQHRLHLPTNLDKHFKKKP